MFGSKYVQFRIGFSYQYSININVIEVDPHSDSLQNGTVRLRNFHGGNAQNLLFNISNVLCLSSLINSVV